MLNYCKEEKLLEKKNIVLDPYLASFFPVGGEDESDEEEDDDKKDKNNLDIHKKEKTKKNET